MKTETILFIEDDPDLLGEVQDILSEYKVSTANSVKSAIIQIFDRHFDFIFSDYKLPDGTGLDILKTVKKYRPMSPLILVTGYADKSLAIAALKEGAFDFIEKPYDKRILDISLGRAIKHRNLQMELDDLKVKLINTEKLASIGLLSSSIVDEIATPIQTIKSLAALSLKNPNTTDILRNQKSISEICNFMTRLVSSLRILASSRDKVKKKDYPIAKIVADIINIVEFNCKAKNITILTPPISKDLKIYCNPVDISQCIINLINNSIYALRNSDKKWIKINVDELENFIKIRVTDNGEGIPKKNKEKIFDIFYTSKPLEEGIGLGLGLGLGLTITKKIIESYNGEIGTNLKNESQTEFFLKIPLQNRSKEN